MIAGESGADCLKIGAELERDRNRDGRISGDRLDWRARLVRGQENLGYAPVRIESSRQRKIEPGMAKLERFAFPAILEALANHGVPPA
jgi:hypothetical protein